MSIIYVSYLDSDCDIKYYYDNSISSILSTKERGNVDISANVQRIIIAILAKFLYKKTAKGFDESADKTCAHKACMNYKRIGCYVRDFCVISESLYFPAEFIRSVMPVVEKYHMSAIVTPIDSVSRAIVINSYNDISIIG